MSQLICEFFNLKKGGNYCTCILHKFFKKIQLSHHLNTNILTNPPFPSSRLHVLSSKQPIIPPDMEYQERRQVAILEGANDLEMGKSNPLDVEEMEISLL